MQRRWGAAMIGAVGAGALGMAIAMAKPIEFEFDLSAPPPDPNEVESQIRNSWTTLGEAISIAESQTGGAAKAAQFLLEQDPPMIEVLVYGGGMSKRVTINSQDGIVTTIAEMPRFPGWDVGDVAATKLPSGIWIYDIEAGDGEQPTEDFDLVKLHYAIYLSDGTPVQDSRDQSAEPALRSLDSLLPGWRSTMPSMREGGRRKLILPPSEAYGERGRGRVPGNASLVLDIELFDVENYNRIPPEEEMPGDPIADAERVESDSGLIYYVLEEGDGPTFPDDWRGLRAKLHYTGYFPDGTIFESSWESGEPAVFPVDALIDGLKEGLKTMNMGEKRKLVIPANLAYGVKGPKTIPPMSTLIFDIELVDIVGSRN